MHPVYCPLLYVATLRCLLWATWLLSQYINKELKWMEIIIIIIIIIIITITLV